MTPDEILVLLQVAQSYDSRNIDRLMQSGWLDAAQRARWNREEALVAIRAHYSESTERIMPGHVTARIRAWRPVSHAPEYRPALTAAPPATAEQRAAAQALFAANTQTYEPRKSPGMARRRVDEPPTVRERVWPEPVRAFSADLGRILSALPDE